MKRTGRGLTLLLRIICFHERSSHALPRGKKDGSTLNTNSLNRRSVPISSGQKGSVESTLTALFDEFPCEIDESSDGYINNPGSCSSTEEGSRAGFNVGTKLPSNDVQEGSKNE